MSAWKLGATAAAAAAAVWTAPAAAPVVPGICSAFGIRRRLSGPGIALTFDDGPHRDGTPAVLDELARHRVPATFFLVGEQVEQNPALAAEIVAAGHEIALHGYAHMLLLRRTPAALEHDLDRALSVIESAAGVSPTCYRPPYGVFSAGALALCRRRGWGPTLWSRWGRDWGVRATPAAIARRAAAGAVAGDIILLHDADSYSSPGSWRRTASALPAILDSLLATGSPLVTLADDRAATCPLPVVSHSR